jgi:hypothetical protein
VAAYGDALHLPNFAGKTLQAPATAMAATPTGKGYWVTTAMGQVFGFGDARPHGSVNGTHLFAPVVGMAAAPDGRGYRLVAADGGVFAFGDARFYGSLGAGRSLTPIVAIASTASGRGYWLVTAGGGVIGFGDAKFYGAMGGGRLSAPLVGIAVTPDGRGYWLAGSDGGVFAFGDARYYGGASRQNIGTWVTGIARTGDGGGYWLAAATAGILPYGDAQFYGPTPNLPPFAPTGAIAATPDGRGYWLLQPDSIRTTFSEPQKAANFRDGNLAVSVAASQIGPDLASNSGSYCNPYGPCEEWCALFATWVWNRVGAAIPRFAWVPDIYTWAAARGLAISPRQKPAPGDLLLYGSHAASLPHVAVVAEVWPDGAVTTIDGDSGPEPAGKFAVTFNGPFLPSQSLSYNGMAVFAYVR